MDNPLGPLFLPRTAVSVGCCAAPCSSCHSRRWGRTPDPNR